MNEVTHSIDSPVSLGPRLFFRYARSNLPEMQLLFRAGKLSPKFGNWDNVIRHCLVEAAETEVFSYLFNLPDNERTKLFKVALCHDWRQRLNKQENSLNNLPPDESASLKKEIEVLLKLKPLKIVPKCSKCGWKFYCKNPVLKKNVKLNDPECIKHFIESEKES